MIISSLFSFQILIRDLYEVNIGECSCADVVDEVSSDAWVFLFGCMLGVACDFFHSVHVLAHWCMA